MVKGRVQFAGVSDSPEEPVVCLLTLAFCGGSLGTADKLEMNQVIGKT
jgi:hypothetical protein